MAVHCNTTSNSQHRFAASAEYSTVEVHVPTPVHAAAAGVFVSSHASCILITLSPSHVFVPSLACKQRTCGRCCSKLCCTSFVLLLSICQDALLACAVQWAARTHMHECMSRLLFVPSLACNGALAADDVPSFFAHHLLCSYAHQATLLVAYLRQMLSQARNDNAALRRALADEGRDLAAIDADIDAGDALVLMAVTWQPLMLTLMPGMPSCPCAHAHACMPQGRDLADIDAGQAGSGWEYTQHLKQHNRELELDNTKLNIQVVYGPHVPQVTCKHAHACTHTLTHTHTHTHTCARTQEDLRKELAAANDRMFGLQADLELARAAHTAPQGAGVAADGGNESGAATGGEGSAGAP
eukprot:1142944-Pelagomonas_calceolata.AAC.1